MALSSNQTFCRLVLMALALSMLQLNAQMNFGRISGTVADSSSAVMPGVIVHVINEATGAERTATSNDTGSYIVTNLPVGTYTVKAEPAGFQAEARTGLTLMGDGRVTVDLTFRPAGATQSVDAIAATSEAINTISGEVARQINTQQVERSE